MAILVLSESPTDASKVSNVIVNSGIAAHAETVKRFPGLPVGMLCKFTAYLVIVDDGEDWENLKPILVKASVLRRRVICFLRDKSIRMSALLEEYVAENLFLAEKGLREQEPFRISEEGVSRIRRRKMKHEQADQ